VEKYDVVIIGGGLGSLTTATYLSKRLRNVAVFQEGSGKRLQKFTTRLKDDKNNKFEFKFNNYDLGGVQPGNLFYEYFKRCGLDDKFEYYENPSLMVITKDKRIVKRPNDINEFLNYLIRYYPKQRDKIHDLFNDIIRHHVDYKEQKLARLKNLEYTIPSILIEWGDLSLLNVLNKHFNNEALINEFSLVYDSIGIPLDEINAYNYFIKWFDTFIDGSHIIKTSYNNVVKTFSNEISKSKDKIFTNRKIDKFIIKDNVIEKLIDFNGVEIQAKHYVINMRIDDFTDKYLSKNKKIKQDFYNMYSTIDKKLKINQVYLGLNKDAKELGITEKQYLFSEIPDDELRLLSLVNYKEFDNKSCADGNSALLVEFLDDDLPRNQKLEQVISQVSKYFPKITKSITVSKIGQKKQYFGGTSNKAYWKNKTINDLFEIDNYNSINPFTNGYFIGSWLRPEAGISGEIQVGVEYGDMIDDLIYHGEDEEYFITHDELMAIISHQFISGSLGKEEKNIQFFIGKDSYYIRTKGKHQMVYKGVSDISDIIIIATNESLYNLSVGNTTLEKVLASGALEYVGDKQFLEEVIEGFDMGIEIESAQRYKYVQGKQGLKFMLAIIGTLVLSNLLANYHNYLIVAPITLGVLGGIIYWKYRIYKLITIFEYFIIGLYFLIFSLSIFISELNTLKDSSYTLLIFSLFWLFTWMISKPVAFGYIRHDYRTDYTRTKLFKSMCGGLTFIWGILFLIVALLSFNLIKSYSSLSYYLAILGIYLTYYYPNSYIKGTINK